MLILAPFTGCNKQVFSVNRTGNTFKLDYTNLNETKTHEMKLKEGTVIHVNIENKSGRVDILVADANGQEMYRGDNAASSKFSITTPKAGTYKFSVTGSKARGSTSFKVAD